MKRTGFLMKVLIILPIFLLAALLVWIAVDGRGEDAGENQASGGMSAAAKTETGAVPVSETDNDDALKLDLSETDPADTAGESDTEAGDPVIHMIFSGDIYFSSHVLAAYDNAGGIQGVLDEAYRNEIGRADIFMANEEFPFSDRGTPMPDKQFTFRVSPERALMMQELGIDIVTIANNHTLDYGTDALEDTCTTLKNTGIRYVGAGADMDRAKQLETIEVRGRTIGFLAASRVLPDTSWVAGSKKAGMVSGYDPSVLLQEIGKARAHCDYLVVYMHWGIEKDDMPQNYQRILGRQLIDAGADLVIGAHPHVLQGIEYYRGKPIVYSLGNFIFGSSIPTTALLRADVDTKEDAVNLSLIPGTSGAGYTKELTDPKKTEGFYQYMQSISPGVTIDENGVAAEAPNHL